MRNFHLFWREWRKSSEYADKMSHLPMIWSTRFVAQTQTLCAIWNGFILSYTIGIVIYAIFVALTITYQQNYSSLLRWWVFMKPFKCSEWRLWVEIIGLHIWLRIQSCRGIWKKHQGSVRILCDSWSKTFTSIIQNLFVCDNLNCRYFFILIYLYSFYSSNFNFNSNFQISQF